MDYYELWAKRVGEKQKEMDKLVRDIHAGMDSVLRDSPLSEMMYNISEKKYEETTIGAVDGGEGLQELSGVAVYLTRASGFIKNQDSQFIRDLDLGVIPINKQTKARVQFMRATMEYNIASQLIEQFRPDYLLIDGSLLVGVEIDPIKINEYRLYIASLRKMLRLAQESGIRVVGVSEDSTSRGLISYLSEKGLTKEAARTLNTLTDVSLIQLYTQRLDDFKPIATNPFLPVSNKGRDWVKKHTNIDKSFPTFYMQATQMGRAMRVDFPSDGKNIGKEAKEISSFLSYLSQIPKRYGYPLPLYLAHSDAELPKKLIEKTTMLIQKQIFKSWGDEYLAMYSARRRDSRPADFTVE